MTAIAVANVQHKGCFIHVLDDASDDGLREAKQHLFQDLQLRGLIHRYEALPKRIGFCAGRELLVDRLLRENRFTHWFHLDDDILIGNQTIQEAVADFEGPLNRQGIVHVYANPWAKWEKDHEHFATVSKIGGACFVVSRELMQNIGNPYKNQTNGEKANSVFWGMLKEAGYKMFIRWTNPYHCQHTGNVESTIFGFTPSWEPLYAKDHKSGKIVDVPPFLTEELRVAIRTRNLSGYAWRMNMRSKIPVKLPSPGSQIVVESRQKR